jgi:hypothetical protein
VPLLHSPANRPTRRLAPRLLLAALALALAAPAARADDEPPVPSDPVFRALRTDATTVSGRLRRLDPAGPVVLDGEGGRTHEIPLAGLVSLRRETAPVPPAPEGGLLLFPEGDRLRGVIGAATETTLPVAPAALGDASTAVPLGSLLGVLFAPPADPAAAEALRNGVRDTPRDSEVLWLANGDRLAGSLLSLAADAVGFQPDTGPVTVPRGSVVALGFDPALATYPRPAGPFLELTFTDGSRLGVSGARLERGALVGTTRFGAEVRPALSALAAVHVRGPHLAYLTERAPAGASYVGYLGRHPEAYGKDATWDGHDLRLGGVAYDRGVGTLPRTLLAYRLEPGDRRFQATVGLDERAGELASVVFRVLVDEQERFASPPLSRRDAPVPVDVNVTGAKLLILVTEFGDRGDVQDVADWAEARLVR